MGFDNGHRRVWLSHNMSSRSTRLVFTLVFVIVLLGRVDNVRGSEANSTLIRDGQLIIEGMFALTNAKGEPKANDVAAAEAMIYEIENINRRNDILPGFKLGYEIFDDKNGDLHVIMEQTIKIVSKHRPRLECRVGEKICVKDRAWSSLTKPVSALLGPATSGNTVPVASLLGLYNIPQIGYSASSSLLSDKSRFKSFLRTIPSDHFQAEAIASLVKYFGWNYVFFVASDDEYGRQGLASFKNAARKLNVCTAGDVNIAFQRDESTKEVQDAVTKIAAHERVRVVVLFMFESQAARIFQESTRQGVGNITWIMSDAIGSGILGYNVSRTLLHGAFAVDFVYKNIPQFKRHLDNITVRNARGNPWLSKLLENTLNCSAASGMAVPGKKRCSLDEKLDLSLIDFSNQWSWFVNIINGVKAIGHGLHNLMTCKDGLGLLENGRCPNKSLPVNGKDLYLYIRNATFKGAIDEQVAFDNNGDRVTKEYIFKNLVYDSKKDSVVFRTVTKWSSELRNKQYHLSGDVDNVTWNTGQKPESTCSQVCVAGEKQVGQSVCCWACEQCPKGEISNETGATNCTRCPEGFYANEKQTKCLLIGVDSVQITDPFSIIITTISCLGLVAMLATSLLFIHVRATPLIQDSGELLLGLFVLSSTLAFTFSIFQVTLYRTDGTCRLLSGFLLFVILLAATALLAKTKMCDSHLHQFTTHYVKAAAQYYTVLMVVTFLLFQLLLIGIWYLIDSPHAHTFEMTEAMRLRECNSSWSAARFIASAFPLLVLLVATVFAFKERNNRDNHSEAKYISFCTISLCILLIAFFPTYRFVKGITTSIVIATTSLVGGFAITGCIILPKVYIPLVHPRRNVRESDRRSNEPTVSSAHTVSHPGSSNQPEFVHSAGIGEDLGSPNEIELVSSSSSASSRSGNAARNTRVK